MILLFVFCFFSCQTLVVDMVANVLSSGKSTVFTGENDPLLVQDALPFALKLYESLLEQTPKNKKLLLATGSAYIMYANAFIHTPAGMLSAEDFELQVSMKQRAKNLYLRGRNYLLAALENIYPGFNEKLEKSDLSILKNCTKEDIPYLYWASAGWLGAFSLDAFDFDLSPTIQQGVTLMNRALELDESYNNGAIHDFFISYYGALPAALGGSEEKARYHFSKAVIFSQGKTLSPYVALATSVCIKRQNYNEFKTLLDTALAINIDKTRENRLVNTINRQKAQWYLSNQQRFFLDIPEENSSMEDIK